MYVSANVSSKFIPSMAAAGSQSITGVFMTPNQCHNSPPCSFVANRANKSPPFLRRYRFALLFQPITGRKNNTLWLVMSV